MYRLRVQILFFLIFLGFTRVAWRLWSLQVWNHADYVRAEEDRLSYEDLEPALRGTIFARSGSRPVVLARDRPSFDVSIAVGPAGLREISAQKMESVLKLPPAERKVEIDRKAERLASREPLVAELAAFTGASRGDIARGLVETVTKVARDWTYPRTPQPVIRDLPQETWLRLRAALASPTESGVSARLPGVSCTTSARRSYPQGTTACHVVGCIGQYKAEHLDALRKRAGEVAGTERPAGRPPDAWALPGRVDLADGECLWLSRPKRYLQDARTGTQGVERACNQTLRGKHGYRVVLRTLKRPSLVHAEAGLAYLNESRPLPGGSVELTIDLRYQRAAERALAKSGYRGAAVFLDPNSGEVLALASWPPFDPNVLVPGGGRGAERARLLQNSSKPLLCRAYREVYPLGSVFKVLIAAAALEEGVITPQTSFACTHYIIEGDTRFGCMGYHGTIPFDDALTRSCNIYFYKTGGRLGIDRIADWGRRFSFGRRTGIDLPGEAAGIMPDRAWKAAERPNEGPWTRGNTYHVSIGQIMAVTPLQVAVMMAAVANGGTVWRPYVNRGLGPKKLGAVKLTDKSLKPLREAMKHVVSSPYGTGRRARMTTIDVAGKTGTAEIGRRGVGNHAWFAGYADADDPSVAFAVVLEHGRLGGAAAAPVARKVLEAVFGEGEGR